MSVTFAAYHSLSQTFSDTIEDINMNNSNASHVLDALGFGEDVAAGDLCGTVSAEDFLGRVLMALAVSPIDEGVPAHELPSSGMRWIEGGRREGYLQERLSQLHTLASQARDRGFEVTWA